MKKIERGIYEVQGLFLVATEKLGKDKRLDWVAVKTLEAAQRIAHGNTPTDYEYIHNRLRDLRALVEEVEAKEGVA